jgi:hypothetical protein
MEVDEARLALRAYLAGKKLEPATVRELYLAGYIGVDLEAQGKDLLPTEVTEKGRQLLVG